MVKSKARLRILNILMSSPTIQHYHWNKEGETIPQIGDLVALYSAPITKWYLSWIMDIDPNNGYTKYLLESIEDGETAWWENVGIDVYSRIRVKEFGCWRWEDKQFEFNDKWKKVCREIEHDYLRANQVEFNDDGSVILKVSLRFSEHEYTKTFPDWKKVTKREMIQFYNQCVKEYEESRKYMAYICQMMKSNL